MRHCLAMLAMTLVASSAAAHDFWVQPAAFWMQPQAVTSLTLQAGHGSQRQRSQIRLSRITHAYAVGASGERIDLRASIHPGDDNEDGALRFVAPGTYVVVLATDNKAQSHLPAQRYNDYLEDEGLTPALTLRARTQRMDTEGSEIYSRQSKAIVQVGSTHDSQQQVTTAVGLPLEIVPELNPYAATQSQELPVRVIYEGNPLPGALVKLTNLEHDTTPVAMHVTDRNGRAKFVMPTRGSWLLNVVWTRPLPATSETEFETFFSSLSFGFPAP